jgi:hypothetical protein
MGGTGQARLYQFNRETGALFGTPWIRQNEREERNVHALLPVHGHRREQVRPCTCPAADAAHLHLIPHRLLLTHSTLLRDGLRANDGEGGATASKLAFQVAGSGRGRPRRRCLVGRRTAPGPLGPGATVQRVRDPLRPVSGGADRVNDRSND